VSIASGCVPKRTGKLHPQCRSMLSRRVAQPDGRGRGGDLHSVRRALIPLIVLALASCGGVGSQAGGRQGFERALSDVQGLKGKERERKLQKLARAQGGKLTVYTSLTSKTESAVAHAFEAAYPGINVSTYRSTSETVATRVSQEARAGFAGADAVETAGTELVTLRRQGIFFAYRPQGWKRLVPGALHDGWTGTRFTTFAVSWNTRLVPAGRQPRSWEELAGPKWRGKLALEESDADWYEALRSYWVREGKSSTEADRLLDGIARNARIVASHNLMAELLAAGEYAVAPTNYLHLTRDSIEEGAPVSYRPLVQPVISRPQGIGLLAGGRHPAAAILYADWLTGPGQRVLQRFNVEPVRRDLAGEPGAREVAIDVENFAAHSRTWMDRYERLLRLGRRVESKSR
jgi:iron(III) transport system substrate-binding protein